MATAKPNKPTPKAAKRTAPRSRRWLRLALVAGIVVLGLLVWFWRPLNAYALTGASYGARVGCACRFVAGRELKHCRRDFESGMALITLSEDLAQRSVTARFPLLASQTATLRDGAGCVMEPWRD